MEFVSGLINRTLQSIFDWSFFDKGGAIMQPATAAKVTLLILIAILIVMIRNVFAVEHEVSCWSAQYAGQSSSIGLDSHANTDITNINSILTVSYLKPA